MTVLVTGYEPFGDHDENPTAAVADELDGTVVGGDPDDASSHRVVGDVLPVEFDAVRDELSELLDAHDPAVVVGTGLSAGRAGVSVERVGVNVADAVTVPDNADVDPENERIDLEGPAAYLSTLPVEATVDRLLDDGVPARVSNTAGTHCCNLFLYTVHHLLDEETDAPPAGFVHLPLTPSMAAEAAREANAHRGGSVQPSLPIEIQKRAVRTTIETALRD